MLFLSFNVFVQFSIVVVATTVFLELFYLLALWPLVRLAAGATFIWLNLLWTITKTVENCCPRRGGE